MYILYRIKDKMGWAWRHFKWIPQRIRYGFWPNDCWNLDITFGKLIYKRLVYFKKHLHGHPANLTEDEWDIILDKMIYTFKASADEVWWSEEYYKACRVSEQEKIESKHQEGLDLFAKYFNGLWD